MKNKRGAVLIETVLILGMLFLVLYYEKEAIKLSKFKLRELQKKRMIYDGEKQW